MSNQKPENQDEKRLDQLYEKAFGGHTGDFVTMSEELEGPEEVSVATKEDIERVEAKLDKLAAKDEPPELTREEIVAQFLENLHRSSKDDRQKFFHTCNMWLDFAYARTPSPKGWNKSLVIQWFKHLEDKGYRKKSQRTMQGITKRVFDAAAVSWPMGKRDMTEVRPSDMTTPVAKMEDIRAMVESAKGGRLSTAETAFLALSTTYGLRREELIRVRPEDIDYDTGRIYIRTAKGGVERWHGLPQEIIPYLKRYNFERRYTKPAVTKIYERIEQKSDVPHVRQAGWHSIRRSVDTALRRWSHINTSIFLRWKLGGDFALYYDKSDPTETDREVFKHHPFLAMWRD